jgi:hypothetical protein
MGTRRPQYFTISALGFRIGQAIHRLGLESAQRSLLNDLSVYHRSVSGERLAEKPYQAFLAFRIAHFAENTEFNQGAAEVGVLVCGGTALPPRLDWSVPPL